MYILYVILRYAWFNQANANPKVSKGFWTSINEIKADFS